MTRPELDCQSLTAMPDGSSENGEWYWNNDTFTMSYILKGSSEEDRGVGVTSFPQGTPLPDERRASPVVYRCYFEGCVKPAPPTLPPTIDGLPDVYYNYSSGLDTNSIFLCFLFVKINEPLSGNTILFRSSQQLPRLCLGPSKGFLS